MNSAEIISLTHANMVDIYGCLPLAFTRGEGSWLYDADGNRYLDFFCGLAVTSLGHKHPGVVRAICEQAEKLTHVSNVFHTEPGARLLERLAKRFGDGKVFLGNSGAEANEAAIKLARKWGHKDGKGRFEIIATLGSFPWPHDGDAQRHRPGKISPGIFTAGARFQAGQLRRRRRDRESIGDQTVAIMVEPIQGEGGVVVPHDDYLKRLRELCDRANLLLILDEVQTGVGRTGKFFCYEHTSIKPDIVTLAKALGGGLPIGAMIAKPEIASALTPGSHGTTFGGNPVACAAALAVNDALDKEGAMAERHRSWRVHDEAAERNHREDRSRRGSARPRHDHGRSPQA